MIKPENMIVHVDEEKPSATTTTEKPVKFSIEDFTKHFTAEFLNLSKEECKRILDKLNHKNVAFDPSIQNNSQMSMAITEAKQKEFIISNIDGKFYRVNGTKLSDDLFARNGGSLLNWVISDIASGTAVKLNLHTLADCKKYVKEMTEEEKAKIEKQRNLPSYKEFVEKVKAINIEDLDSYDIKESLNWTLSETLDVLNEEEQISLFDL